jgi:site-specific DNA-methyltransferase (adenine-specific)
MEYKNYIQKTDFGKIKLYQADCMEMLPQVPDKYYDLCICDPPYGIERFQKSFGTTRFKSDNRCASNGIKWDIKPSPEYFLELKRVSECQIIWGANNFSLPESEYFIIWDKEQTVDNFASAEMAWTNCKRPAKVFRYSIHKHNKIEKIHPTQKPVALYQWLLKNYAKPGDKILDTHGGSCSIAIACDIMGFDADIYEIDKDYYEAALDRFNRHKQQIVMEF